MSSTFSMLVCILACVVGIWIGRAWRKHKAKKDPLHHSAGIDMSRYKNLTAARDWFAGRSRKDKKPSAK